MVCSIFLISTYVIAPVVPARRIAVVPIVGALVECLVRIVDEVVMTDAIVVRGVKLDACVIVILHGIV